LIKPERAAFFSIRADSVDSGEAPAPPPRVIPNYNTG